MSTKFQLPCSNTQNHLQLMFIVLASYSLELAMVVSCSIGVGQLLMRGGGLCIARSAIEENEAKVSHTGNQPHISQQLAVTFTYIASYQYICQHNLMDCISIRQDPNPTLETYSQSVEATYSYLWFVCLFVCFFWANLGWVGCNTTSHNARPSAPQVSLLSVSIPGPQPIPIGKFAQAPVCSQGEWSHSLAYNTLP